MLRETVCEVPEQGLNHIKTLRTKLYRAMGSSGSPQVLRDLVGIVSDLDLQPLIITTTILDGRVGNITERVLLMPHVPAHLVNSLADIALTNGGAGTVQTAIHASAIILYGGSAIIAFLAMHRVVFPGEGDSHVLSGQGWGPGAAHPTHAGGGGYPAVPAGGGGWL
jgi:hypothetical protein